jgi:serine beta-lactamase-like protein LACTB
VKEFPISIRQLLCHQGGIRHYAGAGEIDSTRHYADSLTALDHFKGDSLVAEPGTKYSYTTFGYVLLGAAVERAAERPLMDYVREKIARPAGADMLQADDTYAIIPNRARGYARDTDGRLQNCHLADTSNKIAGGGMCSRPQDLVAFALAVKQGKLLKPQAVEMMWTDQPARDGKPTAYGLGWRIDVIDGRKRISHSGAQQGVSTVLIIYPKEDLVVALMCNLERVRIANLGYEVAKGLLP